MGARGRGRPAGRSWQGRLPDPRLDGLAVRVCRLAPVSLLASDRPARPSMAGRSAGHAAVPLCTGFDDAADAIHGAALLASDRPARPSIASRSAGHAAVPLCTGFDDVADAIHGAALLASDRPARPSMAGRSRPRAPVALGIGFDGVATAIHGVALLASDRPARPSMAGRSAGHAAVPLCTGFDDVATPSMAQRYWLRIALPGHPWPVVRGRARQWRASAAAHPLGWCLAWSCLSCSRATSV